MTKAIEMVFDHIPEIVDREKVCEKCRDKRRCKECDFSPKPLRQPPKDKGGSI
jgi:hypothetical protein